MPITVTLMNEAVGHDEFDIVGFIPSFLDEEDPRSAKEQFNDNYISGWKDFKGHAYAAEGHVLKYPGEPPLHPLAMINFRDEVILVYPHAWVAILSKEEGAEPSIARMD